MDFNQFLTTSYKFIPNNGVSCTIKPWMNEVRQHKNVLASVPRQAGTTTYIILSALYDVLFTDIQQVRVITHQGGYRKKHFIDMLATYYSWMMQDLKLNKQLIRSTECNFSIENVGDIEVFGIHELDTKSRGKYAPDKLYADICSTANSDASLVLMQPINQKVIFFQGIQTNNYIKQVFDANESIDNMDKVYMILKEQFYWHTMRIPHTLTPEMENEIKSTIGDARFNVEYGS